MRYFMVPLLLLVWIAQAADRDLAGRYAGEWKSNNSGASGSVRISLEPSTGGTWKCEVTFTLEGEEVRTIMRSAKLEQSKLDVAYDFTVQGTSLRSHIIGTWNGKAFDGQYQTTAVESGAAIDDGTWSAVRGK
jgi:hypothetical protein